MIPVAVERAIPVPLKARLRSMRGRRDNDFHNAREQKLECHDRSCLPGNLGFHQVRGAHPTYFIEKYRRSSQVPWMPTTQPWDSDRPGLATSNLVENLGGSRQPPRTIRHDTAPRALRQSTNAPLPEGTPPQHDPSAASARSAGQAPRRRVEVQHIRHPERRWDPSRLALRPPAFVTQRHHSTGTVSCEFTP